jgi:hypothetical protein
MALPTIDVVFAEYFYVFSAALFVCLHLPLKDRETQQQQPVSPRGPFLDMIFMNYNFTNSIYESKSKHAYKLYTPRLRG